jgi:hypothetical protein
LPNRRVHNYWASLLGVPAKLADQVNADMDEPAKWLGPRHRAVRHDSAYALAEAAKYRDPKAFLAAQAHIALDDAARDPALRKAFALLEVLLRG